MRVSFLKSADLEAMLTEALADHAQNAERRQRSSPSPEFDLERVKKFLRESDFENGAEISGLIQSILRHLDAGVLNFHHPRYFGVFNPSPSAMGIVGQFLSALYNPQLASSKSAPFPLQVERFLIRYLGVRAGYAIEKIEGTFTTGGTEANLSALLCALYAKFPQCRELGVAGLSARPVVYASSETHHSVQKAMLTAGLGLEALRVLKVDTDFKLPVDRLQTQIQEDLRRGLAPLMVVATLGSTSGGVLDPVSKIASVCRAFGLWLHVDAAFGGAAVLLDDSSHITQGMDRSDSFTLDAHKWLNMPFGCSMLITRQKGCLRRAFSTEDNVYMPQASDVSSDFEPYRDSLQWSRRFAGLGLFMELAQVGRSGVAASMERHMKMADELRRMLREVGLTPLNETPLPVVCVAVSESREETSQICDELCARLKAFLTVTVLGDRPVLRIGINNGLTSHQDLRDLVEQLHIVVGESRGAVLAPDSYGH